MGQGHEARLEGGRRQVDALFQHQVEEALEALGVATQYVLVAGYTGLIGEEDAEHTADMVHHQRNALLARGGQQARGQVVGQLAQLRVDTRLVDLVQAGVASGHGDRVTGQGTGLVDRAGRCQRFHHLTASAEGAYRHAATDDLAQAGQIRGHVVVLLRATQGDAEAGHHLVDDQQRAILIAQFAQALQEARLRRNAVHVAGHRFDDDTGDLLRILGEGGAYRRQIVVLAGQGMFGEVGRNARRVRLTEGQGAGTGLDQQVVGVAMVAAFELDDLIAPGEATRQADGAHGGFGTGVHHAHHVHAVDQRGHQFGHAHFHLGRGTKTQPVFDGGDHRVADRRMVVPQDHRSPGAYVVDVGLTIGIIQVGAVGPFDKQRRTANAGEGANRGVHSAGD